MPKLRKILPNHFQELVDTKDDEAIKTALSKCEVGAYKGDFKKTVFFYTGFSKEMVQWLLERGEDINYKNQNYVGKTPLHAQAGSETGTVALYLEFGADIEAEDKCGRTPLFDAIGRFRIENVKILLEHGADFKKRCFDANPLEYLLEECWNETYLESTADIAVILLEAGIPISDDMKKSVAKIGEHYELHKEQFSPEFAESARQAMTRLYELFDVPPVPAFERHYVRPWTEIYDDAWEPGITCIKGQNKVTAHYKIKYLE